MNLSESKDFPVSTSSLKEVRIFSREVFEKLSLDQDLKDELVLAIAEAAQNIVKHGYKGVEETSDRMEIKISLNDGQLEIGFFDKDSSILFLLTLNVFIAFFASNGIALPSKLMLFKRL